MSPGFRPVIVVSGTRESEHPIHRIDGDCPDASLEKKSGSESDTDRAHSLFCDNA